MKKRMALYLGIDTSAYTTSLAIVDDQAVLVYENRKVLDVPQGERGLAQSVALFQHVQNLPQLVAAVPQEYWGEIAAIGVSTAPRPLKESYMPVFTPGFGVATAMAAARCIPLVLTSHQEGHLAAGLISSELSGTRFLAVHISGGTTELLEVQRQLPGQMDIRILGGTTDLHAGQFIDRVGVRLGLPFPAGKSLEALARQANPEAATWLPSAVKEFEVSFSGVESAAQRLIDQGKEPADVARAVEGCIVRTLTKLLKAGTEETSIKEILIVGGVASNQYIRQELERRLANVGHFHWALPNWSRDNAIGVAVLTLEKIKGNFLKAGNIPNHIE
ncbi:O-sialoglycoprotein endopeptidase [Desulfitobacterium dichloroeliminans]|nr:O-sialoglycoprotein endopeptidase [Desulfitobacterium dichloroeliminans]